MSSRSNQSKGSNRIPRRFRTSKNKKDKPSITDGGTGDSGHFTSSMRQLVLDRCETANAELRAEAKGFKRSKTAGDDIDAAKEEERRFREEFAATEGVQPMPSSNNNRTTANTNVRSSTNSNPHVNNQRPKVGAGGYRRTVTAPATAPPTTNATRKTSGAVDATKYDALAAAAAAHKRNHGNCGGTGTHQHHNHHHQHTHRDYNSLRNSDNTAPTEFQGGRVNRRSLVDDEMDESSASLDASLRHIIRQRSVEHERAPKGFHNNNNKAGGAGAGDQDYQLKQEELALRQEMRRQSHQEQQQQQDERGMAQGRFAQEQAKGQEQAAALKPASSEAEATEKFADEDDQAKRLAKAEAEEHGYSGELTLRRIVTERCDAANAEVAAAERAILNGARNARATRELAEQDAGAAASLAVNEANAKDLATMASSRSFREGETVTTNQTNSQNLPVKLRLPPGARRPGAYGGAPGVAYSRVASARYQGLGGSLTEPAANTSSNELVTADPPPETLPVHEEPTETDRPTSEPTDDRPTLHDRDDEEAAMINTSCHRFESARNLGVRDDNLLEKLFGTDYNKTLVFGVCGVCLLILILVIAIPVATSGGGGDEEAAAAVPTAAPTLPQLVQIDPRLIPILAKDTLVALTTDTSSPQYEAYDWISKDPNLDTYPEWKIQQRFALAVFYYAFGGPRWQEPNIVNWLNYTLDECLWMAYDDHACNTDGSVKRLKMTQQRGFRGSLPLELTYLTKLEGLDFSDNVLRQNVTELLSLSDERVTFLPPSLQIIWCDNCHLHGSFPSTLSQLSNLLGLFLSDNDITGTLPLEIGKLSRLSHWEMARNRISGDIPSEIGHLTFLKILDWAENKLESLPTEVGLMTRVELFNLEMNEIASPIPSELGAATKLLALRLRENDMTGTLPTEIGLLSSMVGMHVDDNKFNGTLPLELMRLTTNLEQIFLAKNRLSGSIPSEFRRIKPLVDLDLSDNELTSTIPSELGLLSQLKLLNLENNKLTGTIPGEILNQTRIDIHYDGNAGLDV